MPAEGGFQQLFASGGTKSLEPQRPRPRPVHFKLGHLHVASLPRISPGWRGHQFGSIRNQHEKPAGFSHRPPCPVPAEVVGRRIRAPFHPVLDDPGPAWIRPAAHPLFDLKTPLPEFHAQSRTGKHEVVIRAALRRAETQTIGQRAKDRVV